MNSSKQNYIYEERNENFPQVLPQRRIQRQSGIGKILSKYQNKKVESNDIDIGYKKPVHLGMAINYSQIYNDIKLQQASPYQKQQKEINKPSQFEKPKEKEQKKSQQTFKQSYKFQSATDMGRNFNKKIFPGVIVSTPRSKSRNNEILSEQNQENQQKIQVKPSTYKYRIKQIKDNEKKLNFHQISQLQAKSDKSTDFYKKYEQKFDKKQMMQNSQKKVSEQQKLGVSRSIGVGNHVIFQNYEFKAQLDDPKEQQNQYIQQFQDHMEVQIKPYNQKKIKQLTQVQQQRQKTLTENPKQQQKKIQQKKTQQNKQQEIVVHFEKNPSLVRSPNQSKVTSSIKNNDQNNLVQEIDININLDQPQNNQQQTEQQELNQSFSIQQYTQIYPILKDMQSALKASLINVQQLFRGIKKYLQIIAMGNLDNIDDFNLPLHKKKIIKNSIFYQRVAVIVIAFSYATRTIKDAHKYLINILSYALNNSLILVKVLEQTQISKSRQHHYQGKHRTIIKSDKLSMKRNLDSLRNNNDVLIDSIYKLSKYEDVFYQNLKQTIKLINKTSLQQTFYKILQYIAFYLCVSDLGHMIPFLAVAPDPYLPATIEKKYTLVIDIVQLFCHGTKKSRSYVFRPYSQHFLHQMSQYYQIISFCNAFPNQIDKIIDMVDPKGYIQHRLYKHHAIQKSKTSFKFVQRIGRPLNQLLLLDNENSGGQGSIENCIHIPSWKGNKNDTILAQLCPLLAMIPIKKIDTLAAVKKVRDQAFKNQKQGVKYINFGVILD